MANRWGNQFTHSLIKDVWNIYARVTFGASGAPTLVQGNPAASPGIVSITQNATGQYTFVFGTNSSMLDVWPRLLGANVFFNAGSAAPTACTMSAITNSTATAGTCSMKVRLVDYAGADVNPASGEIGYFNFTFSNSTAP